jgi:universal stress protein A
VIFGFGHSDSARSGAVEIEFKKVLVPTDFSEAAARAIPLAFRLAKDHAGSVMLLHVLESTPSPNPLYAHYYPSPSSEQIRQAEDQARQALLERVPAAYRDSVPTEVALAHGVPAHEILRVAQARQTSLIVIATHGRTGLKHLVLGSVAEQVIRHAPCPVLVVR